MSKEDRLKLLRRLHEARELKKQETPHLLDDDFQLGKVKGYVDGLDYAILTIEDIPE
jgi:hypothetical protein